MGMNFKKDFELRLQTALEKGGYKTTTDFARGITTLYMQTVVKGKPVGVPTTLPSPALSGAPAPVGPATPIPFNKREKVFYNTVRAYFVAKEISQGKGAIQFLTRDLQNLVALGIKLKQEAQQNIDSIKQIDEEIKQLREEIKAVGPAVQEFIASKKQGFKDLKKSIQEFVVRLETINGSQLAAAGAASAFERELGLIETVQNFKFDLKTIRTSVQSTLSIINEASSITKKYENDFSTSANIKMFIWKKLQAFFNEVFEILGAFIDPMTFVSYFKQLLQIPKAKVIGRIMLRIINKNKELKSKKIKLVQAVNENFFELKNKVQKKIENLQQKIQEKADKLLGTLGDSSLIKNIKSAVKWARSELKRVQEDIAFAIKIVKYFFNLINEGIAIAEKVVLLIDATKQFYNKAIKEDILQKTKDKIAALKARLDNTDTTSPIQINALFKQFQITQEPIKLMIESVLNANKLLAPDLLDALKKPTTKLIALVGSLDRLLSYDLINFIDKIEHPPTRGDRKPSGKRAKHTVEEESPVKQRKYTGLFVMEKIKDAIKMLSHWTLVIQKKIQKLQDDSIKKLKKVQKDVTDYISNVTNFDATKKKIDNKRRSIEQKKSEVEEDTKKAVKVAKAAVLFAKMLQSSYKIIDRVVPSRSGSLPEYSISANEKDILDFYKYFGQWRILENDDDNTRKDIADNTRKLKRKIKDFKVYELIFEFFTVALKEAKESGFNNFIKETLKEQSEKLKENVTSEWTSAADSLTRFFESPPKTLSELASFPLDIVGLLDLNVDILKGENRFLTKTKARIKGLADKIPADTEDPTLLFFKRQLEKGVGFLSMAIKLISDFIKAVIKFIREELIDPALNKVKGWIDQYKTRFENNQRERVEKRFDKEARKKVDIAAASAIFGLAGRLFWTAFNWKNPTGTTFITLNVGPFKPMNPEEINGSAGFAQQLSQGFELQVMAMTGLIVPNPSYLIPPIPFQGYS